MKKYIPVMASTVADLERNMRRYTSRQRQRGRFRNADCESMSADCSGMIKTRVAAARTDGMNTRFLRMAWVHMRYQ